MTLFRFTSLICKFLPPQIANVCRELIYPLKKAVRKNKPYSRKSITGSMFSGDTHEYISYKFGIHGFFDWKNILIAKIVSSRNSGSDIIEIGANIGTETIGYADIVGVNGYVHAFEPLPANLKKLEEIKNRNKGLHIKIYPIGLSNCHSTVDFLLPSEVNSGAGKIITPNQEYLNKTIKVEVHPLDEYMANFKYVSCLFLDVEGHEYFVLEGARKTLEKFNPIIVLEVSGYLLEGSSKSSMDIFRFLNSYNYTCYNVSRFLLHKINDQNVHFYTRNSNWICIPATASDIVKPIKKILYKHIFLPLNKI